MESVFTKPILKLCFLKGVVSDKFALECEQYEKHNVINFKIELAHITFEITDETVTVDSNHLDDPIKAFTELGDEFTEYINELIQDSLDRY